MQDGRDVLCIVEPWSSTPQLEVGIAQVSFRFPLPAFRLRSNLRPPSPKGPIMATLSTNAIDAKNALDTLSAS